MVVLDHVGGHHLGHYWTLPDLDPICCAQGTRLMQWVYRLHKWASLLVGLQLMIWLLTGLYFNVVDHETASGNIYRSNATKIMP